MNEIAAFFVATLVGFVFLVKRKLVILPLMVGACYMTYGQAISVGGANFTCIRVLLAFTFLRILIRKEYKGINTDRTDLYAWAWALALICSSFFHEEVNSALKFRLGMAYNSLGIYYLFRFYVRNEEDYINIIEILALVIIPVALFMLGEHVTGKNVFAIFGGVPEEAVVRNGRIRAQGPFAHPILAGTAGAGIMPLMVGLWFKSKAKAIMGIIACTMMTLFSTSSGPIITFLLGTSALGLWWFRKWIPLLKRTALISIILLIFVMEAPVWYLLGRVDLTGSSTGYHRAELINQTIIHFDEWWFAGTDRTRHWMATGVDWSDNHTDITNYYIKMAVLGGMPVLLGFLLIFKQAYYNLKKCYAIKQNETENSKMKIWTIGSSIFAHAITFLSVSYFDQTILFWYLPIASITSLKSFYINAKS